jgi:cytochrome c-type biogenesis protein CcmH/NrfF
VVNTRLRILGLAGIAAALLLGVSAVMAQPAAAEELEGWAYKLPNELMSPFCPGRTISACTSPQADSLRMWLIVQEASGRSREDVEAELFERYGDALRPAPRAEGFGLTAYVFPVLAFLAGGVFIAVFLSRQTRKAATNQPSSQPPDPELERIIDQELAG